MPVRHIPGGGGPTRSDVQRMIRSAVAGSGGVTPTTPVFAYLENDFVANVNLALPTIFPGWSTSPIFNSGGFSVTATGLGVPSAGTYLVSYSILCTGGLVSTRQTVRGWTAVNGVASLTMPSPANYVRNQEGQIRDDLTSPLSPIALDAGDSVGVIIGRAGSNAAPLRVDAGEAFLFVWKMP